MCLDLSSSAKGAPGHRDCRRDPSRPLVRAMPPAQRAAVADRDRGEARQPWRFAGNHRRSGASRTYRYWASQRKMVSRRHRCRLSKEQYVETVSTAAHVVAIDTMARGLGLDELALPQPWPGMPSQYRPAGAKPGGAQERTLTGVLQDVPDSTLASLASISSRVIRARSGRRRAPKSRAISSFSHRSLTTASDPPTIDCAATPHTARISSESRRHLRMADLH
jgi:hypothetical protein